MTPTPAKVGLDTMKRKTVIVGPTKEWSKRGPDLQKKGHTFIKEKLTSNSCAIVSEIWAPSDIHLFHEIYYNGKPRPYRLFYKILGSPNLPDFKEYEDSVTQVDFSGRICSIKAAFEIVRRLPKCDTVTFVLGEKEDRECPFRDVKDTYVIDACPIPHVTRLDVLYPSKASDMNLDSKDMGKGQEKVTVPFLALAQSQIRRIFRHAKFNLPNLELLEVSLPGVETYNIVKESLGKWPRLRFKYDVQIIQDTVTLAELYPREVGETPLAVMPAPKAVDEKPENPPLPPNSPPPLPPSEPPPPPPSSPEEGPTFHMRPILIPTERVSKTIPPPKDPPSENRSNHVHHTENEDQIHDTQFKKGPEKKKRNGPQEQKRERRNNSDLEKACAGKPYRSNNGHRKKRHHPHPVKDLSPYKRCDYGGGDPYNENGNKRPRKSYSVFPHQKAPERPQELRQPVTVPLNDGPWENSPGDEYNEDVEHFYYQDKKYEGDLKPDLKSGFKTGEIVPYPPPDFSNYPSQDLKPVPQIAWDAFQELFTRRPCQLALEPGSKDKGDFEWVIPTINGEVNIEGIYIRYPKTELSIEEKKM